MKKKCEICNVVCKDNYDYNRHINTKKHKLKLKCVEKKNITENITPKFKCEFCGQIYKYKNGLIRHLKLKHESKCNLKDNNNNNNFNKLNDLIQKQNNLILKQQKVIETFTDKNTVNHVHNNIVNHNSININLYLNSNCKNAIDLFDFIKNVKLTTEDLQCTHELGYVEGILKILYKNLEPLKPSERPIHCDNLNKNMQFYVKEKDTWKEDKNMLKIDKGLDSLSRKQIEVLKDWVLEHPNWMQSDSETITYMELVKHCMGGANDLQIKQNKENIKKIMAEKIPITDVI